MAVKTVGIVGYGAFGKLVHTLLRRFAPEIAVKVYTLGKKADKKTFFSLSEVARVDVVILAVPIHAFEDTLKNVLKHVRKDTVIVDVATVKVHTVRLLKKLAKGRRYIASHPVWGPESYEKRSGDVAGLRIVVTDHTLRKPDITQLYGVLRMCGFDVVEMKAGEHDKYLAETLFLTHFIGQIVSRGGFERSSVDTVSFGFLMDAVESVKHDKKLFQDVFKFNPYCRDILERFKKAELDVHSLIESSASIRVASASIRGQRRALTIGVAGARGSFSEEAARAYAKKNKIKKFELDYLISVENVLSELDKRAISLGIFPIENSTGGVVTETVEAMARHNFKLGKMFDIDIKQNLLVRRGVTRKNIKTITSHEQAIGQCKSYLRREWYGTKIKEYEDTAKAAKDLAKGKLPASTAVIASRAAAKLYRLKILEARIQDLKQNFTTFIAAYC